MSYAERVGALPVLILPAANDAGFEPSRSFLPAATTRSERESFQQEFMAARRLETERPEPPVASAIGTLLARHPGFAETHYRLARLLEQKESVGRGVSALCRGPGSRRLSDALSVRLPAGLPRRRIPTRLHLD